ncbi:MAG: tripartite tricarboxylate transporter permease [Mailhella sp.]|nr:tripartite tricarboxylate transporter permease [Mailhella sp.]
MDLILSAIFTALSPACLLANAIGVALGIIFGALPGLTAAMGVALLIPLTFNMPVVEAFSSLLGMYCGAIYGGCITAILVGTPGTVAAAATMLEGPALTARGESKRALDMATISSFIGGIFSCVVLIVLSPIFARAATAFGAAEYFSVALFGMAVVASLASSSPIKGGIAALLGMYLSTIGIDPIYGDLRNTFNMPDLFGGLPIVPVLVGLFAVGQILITLESAFTKETKVSIRMDKTSKRLSFKDLWVNKFNLLRSSIIGVVVGIIPATGVGTASYIAYSSAKNASKTPELYGKGVLEGIAATESANNAVTGGALVPLLTLGIPGDIVVAIILGALMIQGLVPGPLLFTEHPDVVYGIFSALAISNVLMLAMGLLAVRPLAKVLLVPTVVLMPAVLTLCVAGGYTVNNSTFDLSLVFIFGLLGYLMTKTGMPTSPLLLSMILSPIAESNFRRAVTISNGDYSVFFTSPISAAVLLLTLFVIIRVVLKEVKARRAAAAK